MAKKKKSLHDNMNEFKLPDGTKFYAKDSKDALLYAKKVGGGYAKLGTDGNTFTKREMSINV